MKPITKAIFRDRVRCIKEFNSKMFPHLNYGIVGDIYSIDDTYIGNDEYGVCYLLLRGAGIVQEWVNSERFEIVEMPVSGVGDI